MRRQRCGRSCSPHGRNKLQHRLCCSAIVPLVMAASRTITMAVSWCRSGAEGLPRRSGIIQMSGERCEHRLKIWSSPGGLNACTFSPVSELFLSAKPAQSNLCPPLQLQMHFSLGSAPGTWGHVPQLNRSTVASSLLRLGSYDLVLSSSHFLVSYCDASDLQRELSQSAQLYFLRHLLAA